MSKRFGRNRRRKLREEIARWQAAHDLEHRLMRHVAQERDRLSRTLANVERILGEHFVGLPPKTIRDGIRLDGFMPPMLRMQHRDSGLLASSALAVRGPNIRDVDQRCQTVEAWLLHNTSILDPLRREPGCNIAPRWNENMPKP